MDSDLFRDSKGFNIRGANNAVCINRAYRLQNQFCLNNTRRAVSAKLTLNRIPV